MIRLYSFCCFLVFSSCKRADIQSNNFNFEGHNIHYKEIGEGTENLVFLHGWGCDKNAWKNQEIHFKNKAKLILIDLAGFGQSSKDFKAYTIDLFAESTIALLKHLNLTQYHLIGHSLGHPIAKRIAESQPKSVESITIVDGVYFDFPKDPIEKENYEKALNGFTSMFSGEQRTQNIQSFVNSLFIESSPADVRNYTDTTMLKVSTFVGSNTMQNLIDEDVWKKNKIECRTLAVYANIPELPENNDSILRCWYPNLEYHKMDSVGHFLMMEKPVQFNALLEEYIFRSEENDANRPAH